MIGWEPIGSLEMRDMILYWKKHNDSTERKHDHHKTNDTYGVYSYSGISMRFLFGETEATKHERT